MYYVCVLPSFPFQGYISYPRTETTKYPPDFEFRPILTELKKNPEFHEYAAFILDGKIKPPG